MDVQELAGTQCKDHALIVLLQLVVDLGGHERGKLSLGERLVFVERLTMTHGLAAGNATYTTNAGGRLHLTDGAGDLGPQQVDLVVELVQGERPQSWIRLGEEPNNAGSGSEANHDDGSGAVAVVMQERSSPRCFGGGRGVGCGSKQKAMELCGGAREACGGEMRCSADAAQTGQ